MIFSIIEFDHIETSKSATYGQLHVLFRDLESEIDHFTCLLILKHFT